MLLTFSKISTRWKNWCLETLPVKHDKCNQDLCVLTTKLFSKNLKTQAIICKRYFIITYKVIHSFDFCNNNSFDNKVHINGKNILLMKLNSIWSLSFVFAFYNTLSAITPVNLNEACMCQACVSTSQ